MNGPVAGEILTAMTTSTANPQSRFAPKTLARIAGVRYALLIGAAFNERYVLPHIVASGDATSTAANIRTSTALFRAARSAT